MKNSGQQLFKNIYLLIFLSFVFVFCFFVNPEKIWYIQQLVFYVDKPFFIEHISYPGGISEYLSQFLGQFLVIPVLGSIVLFLIIFTTWWFFYRLFIKLSNSLWLSIFTLVIPSLILYLLQNPQFPLIYIIQLLILSIFTYAFYFLLYNTSSSLHYLQTGGSIIKKIIFPIQFLLLSFLLTYLCGVRTFVIFVLISIIITIRKSLKIAWTEMILSTAVLLVCFFYIQNLFSVCNEQFFLGRHILKFEYKDSVVVYLLYFIIPILAYLFIHNKPTQHSYTISKVFFLSILFAITLCAIVVLLPVKSDNILADEFRYLSYKQRWENILDKARKYKSNDRIVNFYTNKALYYTGRLSVNLFDYPQTWGEYALFLTTYTEPTTLLDNCDLFYELGHIGAARYWAFEAQTVFENNPRVLLRLVQTSLILNQPTIAKPFIEKLKKSLIHHKIAKYYEKLVNDSLLISHDFELSTKWKQFPKYDFFLQKKLAGKEMAYLLETESTNRMAYEYLQTYYLLRNEISLFVKKLGLLKNFQINYLPRVYDEAAMAYLYSVKSNSDSIQGFRISDDTKYRFKGYANAIRYFQGNLDLARPTLEELYKNTYWFYLHFVSPVTLKKEVEVENE